MMEWARWRWSTPLRAGSAVRWASAAVIGLGTILGKMMEVSGAAERIGLTLQRCRWLSADVIMVLVGLICGITLFVEVVVLLIPLAFSIAKTNTSLLKLAIRCVPR